MYRKYIEDLKKWLESPYRKPLILWGARQVGKTYLLLDIFAKKYFNDNYIYIDCKKDVDFCKYCEKHYNPKEIINYLSLDKNKEIDNNTLLIFDEAQECLPIISAMKYFCQEYRNIPVVVTGSMVRIKLNRKTRKKDNSDFLFPIGKINQLTIYPLNFEEFLINKNKRLYEKITDSYKNKKALDDSIHNMALEAFYDYMLIGGMPEAVDIYLKTGSYQKALEVIKDLYSNYLSVMSLYQVSQESVIRSRIIYENIYNQLNKESKNFSPSIIQPKTKIRDMSNPIDWLTFSYIVNKSSIIKEKVSLPLINNNESLFRLYLSDMGMFSYQSGINAKNFLSSEGRYSLSGIFFENYVAIEIANADLKLFYWKGKNSAEFEFIIEDNGYAIPIDVKKKKGTLNSITKFAEHNKLKYVVKVSANNYGYDKVNKILTIPFYEVFLYINDIKNNLLIL